MSAQYAKLDGRHWVNQDFVDAVRKLYPATTKKIPLGFSVYTGWTGKDEILFTAHDPLDDELAFDGQLYEVSFDGVAAENFQEKILKEVDHNEPPKAKSKQAAIRHRKQAAGLDTSWGTTLENRLLVRQASHQKEARRGSGLYGYPKSIQSSCETAVKRLNRRAASLMHKAVKKDRHIVAFLETHAARGNNSAAKVLLAAYKNSMPQTSWKEEPVAPEPAEFDLMVMASDKTAAPRWGMYGYPRKTASLGVKTCATIREMAGTVAADLHRRKAARYQRITGFLGEHNKTGNCHAAGLILSCFPEEGFKFKRRASLKTPGTVDEWLKADLDEV